MRSVSVTEVQLRSSLFHMYRYRWIIRTKEFIIFYTTWCVEHVSRDSDMLLWCAFVFVPRWLLTQEFFRNCTFRSIRNQNQLPVFSLSLWSYYDHKVQIHQGSQKHFRCGRFDVITHWIISLVPSGNIVTVSD